MTDDSEPVGDLERRLWRVEQHQHTLNRRQDATDQRLEERASLLYRVEAIERHLGMRNGQQRRDTQPPDLVKTVVIFLIALVFALATGQFLNFIGLFK